MLDRPISDADGAADAIRHPVLDPDAAGDGRDVRGFQGVLLELGARLKLPAMVDADGAPRFRDYADYIVRHERAPGIGLLAGWRGADGASEGKGAPNPQQLARYIANGGFWRSALFQDGQPGLPRLVGGDGLHRQGRADRAAAVFGDAAKIPPRRAGSWCGATARWRTRARGALLRPDADLV
jgi:hypothetical protein